ATTRQARHEAAHRTEQPRHETLLSAILFRQHYGAHPALPSFPTRRSSDFPVRASRRRSDRRRAGATRRPARGQSARWSRSFGGRSEEHTSELQSRGHLVWGLLPEKKKESLRTALFGGAFVVHAATSGEVAC